MHVVAFVYCRPPSLFSGANRFYDWLCLYIYSVRLTYMQCNELDVLFSSDPPKKQTKHFVRTFRRPSIYPHFSGHKKIS